jgi:uncharacterized membrane protein HdeD (DUF308 family)
MNQKLQGWSILSGAVLTGTGAIAIAIASLADPLQPAALTIGVLIVAGGCAMMLSAFQVNVFARIGRLLSTPFRWYAHAYRRQWSTPVTSRHTNHRC